MKKFIALTLAVLMALTIVGCGKKDKDEDTGEPQYNLENPEPIPDGEEDSQGYIGDGKYRNDIKLSCTLESGYEVTLGMGDKDAGVNAIYLNPTCNDPNGAAFYIKCERTTYPLYFMPEEYATVKRQDFYTMDTNSIAAFTWYDDVLGIDATYRDVNKLGVAGQDSILVDGYNGNETLTIRVCDKATGEDLGSFIAHINYNKAADVYYLADMSAVIEGADTETDTAPAN